MTSIGGLPLSSLAHANQPQSSVDPQALALFSQDETKRLMQLEMFDIMYSGKEAEFDRITQLVKAYYSVPMVGISFIDKNQQFLKASIGAAAPVMPRQMSICHYTIQGSNPLVVYDTTQSDLLKNHPLVVNEPFVRFYAGFPILVNNAQGELLALGALCLVDTQPHSPLTDQQIETLQQFARLVSDTLQLRLDKLRATHAAHAKIAFLTNMSHEIRTPMTGIVGLLDTLLQTPLDEQQKTYVNHIKSANEQLMVLVKDMLDLSQIEAGKFNFHQNTVNLKVFTQQLLTLFAKQAADKAIHLQLDYLAEVPNFLKFDSKRVAQIISRLLENAIKFTPTGGQVMLRIAQPPISIDDKKPLTTPVEVLRMQVIDTGIGISPQTQAVIFNSYEQADKFTHRMYGGIGLGLSLCKALAVGMGGDLTVSSEVGRGTTFSLQLPLVLANADEVNNLADANHLAQPTSQANLLHVNQPVLSTNKLDEPNDTNETSSSRLSAHILLVEDNEMNAMVALKTLKKYGYTADRAKDGQEAVNLFTESPTKYQLILMDHQMPIMDGVQATKILKKQFASLPPVIAVTAHATHGDQSVYFDVGMQDCIAKPYKPELLDGVIQKWLHDKINVPKTV